MNKIILFFALLLTAGGVGAQDYCPPHVPVVALYYTKTPQTRYGIGLEIGTQGTDSPWGFYAGYQYRKLSAERTKSDTAGFGSEGSLYVRGAYRLNGSDAGAKLFVTAAPEISVQTGFDLKAGIRCMLPIGGKKALGLEPVYGIKSRTFGVNLIAAF